MAMVSEDAASVQGHRTPEGIVPQRDVSYISETYRTRTPDATAQQRTEKVADDPAGEGEGEAQRREQEHAPGTNTRQTAPIVLRPKRGSSLVDPYFWPGNASQKGSSQKDRVFPGGQCHIRA